MPSKAQRATLQRPFPRRGEPLSRSAAAASLVLPPRHRLLFARAPRRGWPFPLSTRPKYEERRKSEKTTMRGTTHDLINFWLTPWSKPIREACEWVSKDGAPLSGKAPNTVAPWWVRPFFLSVWVTEAITARLAWLAEHPAVPKERFGWQSETDWKRVVWTFAEAWCLHEMDVATL